MKRRHWMTAAGALAAAAALPERSSGQAGRGKKPPDGLETEVVRLRLRHTWTTTMSSSEHRDTIELLAAL